MAAKKKISAKSEEVKTPAKAAAKKAVTKKASAAAKPKAVTKKAPAVAKTKAAAPVVPKPAPLSPEQRYQRVQTEAYYIAEKDGFRGDATVYWTKAEEIVSRQLA